MSLSCHIFQRTELVELSVSKAFGSFLCCKKRLTDRAGQRRQTDAFSSGASRGAHWDSLATTKLGKPTVLRSRVTACEIELETTAGPAGPERHPASLRWSSRSCFGVDVEMEAS